jgi:hypothetical protein
MGNNTFSTILLFLLVMVLAFGGGVLYKELLIKYNDLNATLTATGKELDGCRTKVTEQVGMRRAQATLQQVEFKATLQAQATQQQAVFQATIQAGQPLPVATVTPTPVILSNIVPTPPPGHGIPDNLVNILLVCGNLVAWFTLLGFGAYFLFRASRQSK